MRVCSASWPYYNNAGRFQLPTPAPQTTSSTSTIPPSVTLPTIVTQTPTCFPAGVPSPWGEWSQCDENTTLKWRTRVCLPQPPGCIMGYVTQTCIQDLGNSEPCPIASSTSPVLITDSCLEWQKWEAWSKCSYPCGMCGEQQRVRKCVNPFEAQDDIETQACESTVCTLTSDGHLEPCCPEYQLGRNFHVKV
ncbi:hypothetical protein L596_030735 [Steinernema carpocapsae]|uniref:Uncharacterized protein n=1 Tax=Steinernema carpocapsae TaxID=34508 RepID=A0A4U5LNL4_STECR|nr:hypothetical protein L596_030735 [Steinernema carpocapsae]